jgi:predicted nucleic acid-binding protein
LAAANDCRFVTADEALVRKLRGNPVLSERVLSLTDAESGNS